MNSILFTVTPYVNMASTAMMNATTTLNATAQEFLVTTWPVWAEKAGIFWERFKADPNNWIALYPLTLFFLAIWMWNMQDNRRMGAYKNIDEDMLRNNMFARPHRLYMLVDEFDRELMRKKGTHSMIRRSQHPASFYMLE